MGANHLVLQVYGANTDVGKTIVSGGLCRAAAASSYIKPVQTGEDSDGDWIRRHCGPKVACSTLHHYSSPVSPHLAAERAGVASSVSDDALLEGLVQAVEGSMPSYSRSTNQQGVTLTVVETAGAPLSPGPSGTLQADLYRPLRLPVVMVGDGKLGGIGVTLSAIESLRVRGYDVAAVALIGGNDLGNAEAIRGQIKSLGVPVVQLPPLPSPEISLDGWFEDQAGVFKGMLDDLMKSRKAYANQQLSLAERAKDVVWWPFTQHRDVSTGNITTIDSAFGDHISVMSDADRGSSDSGGLYDMKAMFDGPASWWTQGVGHGDVGINMAIAQAGGRYGHVLFPGCVHEPALLLAEEMVTGKGWAGKAFYSDDGSTAVEVALKMGFRHYLQNKYSSEIPTDIKVSAVAQADCYHGDTLGVMVIAEPSVYNAKQHPWYVYTPKGLFFKPPTVSWIDGDLTLTIPSEMMAAEAEAGTIDAKGPQMASLELLFDYGTRDSSDEASIYRCHIQKLMAEHRADGQCTELGSLLLEPVLLGAGGMMLVDPLFQRILVQECRREGIPVIYDEVFCGLWRLGVQSCRELLGVDPDIGCYAKLLTGGVIPLAITLASNDIFHTFKGSSKAEALLHGHSYTAHPMGCAAGVHALKAFKDCLAKEVEMGDEMGMREGSHPASSSTANLTAMWGGKEVAKRVSCLPNVARAISIGTVFIVEMKADVGGYEATAASAEILSDLKKRGIYARPLGNVVYVMASPLTPPQECQRVLGILEDVLNKRADESCHEGAASADQRHAHS
ncbi:unnamed protein product [Chrysoparadoxa australica]